MFKDVVIPSNNEKEFIKIAEKINTSALILLYREFDKNIKEKIKKLQKETKIKLFSGLLVSNVNHSQRASTKYDYVFGKDNRGLIENKFVKIHYDFEVSDKKDFIHYRNSGMNQVLAKIMKEKKKVLAFNINNIIGNHLIMGRITQNIKLARKYKIKMMLASFAKKPLEMIYSKDLVSIGITLGMQQKEAKDSVNSNI
jgi:RNase P/RNase MRP subunit p30